MRIQTVNICERLGIDLPTYLRMCMARMIQENSIPFSMKLTDEPENRGLQAMKAVSRIAQEHRISEMSLGEINAEITAVRGRLA